VRIRKRGHTQGSEFHEEKIQVNLNPPQASDKLVKEMERRVASMVEPGTSVSSEDKTFSVESLSRAVLGVSKHEFSVNKVELVEQLCGVMEVRHMGQGLSKQNSLKY
jgi:hypothetical protein